MLCARVYVCSPCSLHASGAAPGVLEEKTWHCLLSCRPGSDPRGSCPSSAHTEVVAPRRLVGRVARTCAVFPVVSVNHSHKQVWCGFSSGSFFSSSLPFSACVNNPGPLPSLQ